MISVTKYSHDPSEIDGKGIAHLQRLQNAKLGVFWGTKFVKYIIQVHFEKKKKNIYIYIYIYMIISRRLKLYNQLLETTKIGVS